MDNSIQDEKIELNIIKKNKNISTIKIFQIIRFIIILLIFIYFIFFLFFRTNSQFNQKLNILSQSEINYNQMLLNFESKLLNLVEINKRRIFDKRYPLPKEIKCYEHIREGGLKDLMAFTSFLTENTTFFEFGSGCTTIIAKYYAKKTYAVEGNKKWYEKGIKNGLKDIIIFKDIKPDGSGPLWSSPGKNSSLDDWKNYFQSYKKEYNADVILIDGRFRVACALDIFSKIKEDTIILIHEYFRPQYLIIEKYYDYIYHWDTLYLFRKKSNINKISLDFQKNFWTDST